MSDKPYAPLPVYRRYKGRTYSIAPMEDKRRKPTVFQNYVARYPDQQEPVEATQGIPKDYKGGQLGPNGEPLPKGATAFTKYGTPYFGDLDDKPGFWNDVKNSLHNFFDTAVYNISKPVEEQRNVLEGITEEDKAKAKQEATTRTNANLADSAQLKIGTTLLGNAIHDWNNVPLGLHFVTRTISEVINGVGALFSVPAKAAKTAIGTGQGLAQGYDLDESYHSAAITYSSWIEPGLRAEYVRRFRAGENPVMLAMELENPIAEAIGESILDPLFVVGIAGKVATKAKGLAEATKFVTVDKASELGRAFSIAENAEDALGGITAVKPVLRNAAREAAKGVDELAQMTGGLVQTSSAKVSTMGDLSGDILRVVMPAVPQEQMPDFIKAWAIIASDTPDDKAYDWAVQIALKSKARDVMTSPAGLKVGQLFSDLLVKGGKLNKSGLGTLENVIKVAKESDNPAATLIEKLNPVLEDIAKAMFPDVRTRVAEAAKVKQLITEGKAIPRKYAHLIKDGKLVEVPRSHVYLAEVGRRLDKFTHPVNKFFAAIYMGMNPAYAFRNLITNTVHMLVDEGTTMWGFWKSEQKVEKFGMKSSAMRGIGRAGGPGEGLLNTKQKTKFWNLGTKGAEWIEQKCGTKVYWKAAERAMDDMLPKMYKELDPILAGVGLTGDEVKHLHQLIYDAGGDVKKGLEQFRSGDRKSLGILDGELQKRLKDYDIWDEVSDAYKTSKNADEFKTKLQKVYDDVLAEANKAFAEEVTPVEGSVHFDEVMELRKAQDEMGAGVKGRTDVLAYRIVKADELYETYKFNTDQIAELAARTNPDAAMDIYKGKDALTRKVDSLFRKEKDEARKLREKAWADHEAASKAEDVHAERDKIWSKYYEDRDTLHVNARKQVVAEYDKYLEGLSKQYKDLDTTLWNKARELAKENDRFDNIDEERFLREGILYEKNSDEALLQEIGLKATPKIYKASEIDNKTIKGFLSSVGYNGKSHALRSVNKRLGKEYKSFDEIPWNEVTKAGKSHIADRIAELEKAGGSVGDERTMVERALEWAIEKAKRLNAEDADIPGPDDDPLVNRLRLLLDNIDLAPRVKERGWSELENPLGRIRDSALNNPQVKEAIELSGAGKVGNSAEVASLKQTLTDMDNQRLKQLAEVDPLTEAKIAKLPANVRARVRQVETKAFIREWFKDDPDKGEQIVRMYDTWANWWARENNADPADFYDTFKIEDLSPEDNRIIALEAKQAGVENIKGGMYWNEVGRGVIEIYEKGDASTFVHEMAHMWLPMLNKNDLAIVERWYKSEFDIELRPLWEWGTKEHEYVEINGKVFGEKELFARAFERYLAEGAAPTNEIKAVFEKFKQWMVEVYRGITGTSIDVPINDELRGLFDDWAKNMPEQPIDVRPGQTVLSNAGATRLMQEGEPLMPPLGGNTPSNARGLAEQKAGIRRLLDIVESKTKWDQPAMAISPEQENALAKWAAQAEREWVTVKAKAMEVGKAARKFTLLDYSDKRGFDVALAYLMPYHYWYNRTYQNWFTRIKRDKWILASYSRYRDALEKQHAGMPDWWKYNVNTNELFGLDSENPLFFNLEAALNPINGLTGVDFNDPDRSYSKFAATVDAMGKFGPTIWSPIALALGAYAYASGNPEGGEAWIGRSVPVTGTIRALTSGMNLGSGKLSSGLGSPFTPAGLELDPATLLQGGLGKYERGRVGRMLGQFRSEQRYPEEQIVDAAMSQSGPIWEEAVRESMQSRALGQSIGGVLGVGFKGRSQKDVLIDQFYAEQRALIARRPDLSPEEYRQMWNVLRERYPFMDALLLARKGDKYRDSALAYNVFGRIPPGSQKKYADAVGLDSRLIDKFYQSKGDFRTWTQTDKDKFLAGVRDLGAVLAVPPDTLRHEWSNAKFGYNQVEELAKKRWGAHIQDEVDTYYALKQTGDDETFLVSHPELEEYFNWKADTILNDPLLNRYYGGIDFLQNSLRMKQLGQAADKFGDDIFEVMATYWEIKDISPEGAKSFLNNNPKLLEYFVWKSNNDQELAKELEEAGKLFPEEPQANLRPDAALQSIGAQDVMSAMQESASHNTERDAIVASYAMAGAPGQDFSLTDYVKIQGGKYWPGVINKREQWERLSAENPAMAVSFYKANKDLQQFIAWEKSVKKTYNSAQKGYAPSVDWEEELGQSLYRVIQDFKQRGEPMPEYVRNQLASIAKEYGLTADQLIVMVQ